ncbi:ATPase, T2SS/T4P/T4SS family [Planctomycetota bacterium]
MPDLLLASAVYGGYISLFKIFTFILFFIGWIPLVGWISKDSEKLGTKGLTWLYIVLGAGALGALIWLVIPIFIAGFLFYILSVGGTAMAYVKVRNAQVSDFDRVMTIDHFKNLLASKEKRISALSDYTFITANRNEIPLPEPRTADYFGYKTTFEILTDAIWRRATNVIFSPTQQDYKISYYIDGVVTQQPSMPKDRIESFIVFAKHLADLDTEEKRKPQKGIFKFYRPKDRKEFEWEVITAGSTEGEQVRIKQIAHHETARLSDLGLMPEQSELIKKVCKAKQGLFIISGTEKSGVTTSLYALLKNHDAFMKTIVTLEKQISEPMQNITQNAFSLSDTGTTTFAKKLQGIVRMGPDIVGVGDCDDAQTARVACAAARDGKLVCITIKAGSVIQALDKWLKYVGDKKVAARTLLGISNQRLIRKLCEECKEAYTPDKELFRKFNISSEKTKVLYRAGKMIYNKRGKGKPCEKCQGTGYFGRTGIFELVTINEQLAKAIETQPIQEVGKQFRRSRMLFLQEQALRKVIAGNTTINDMIRALKGSTKKS